MKKYLFIALVMVIAFTACTNRDTVTQEEQDSLAAAAADSMLNDAVSEDTTGVDAVAVDSSKTDSL
jgi:ABC-type enterochelin transport system substrate-binding protein